MGHGAAAAMTAAGGFGGGFPPGGSGGICVYGTNACTNWFDADGSFPLGG
jgi:hypothetical protein